MPKRPARKPSKKSPLPPARPVAAKHQRHWPLAGMACAAGWVLYLAAARLFFGPEQVWWLQKLLGLFSALIALAAYGLLTRNVEASAEILQRLQMEHAEFGKLLHHHHSPKAVKLPLLGEITVRALCGAGIFLAVVLWWFTPWAPVRVKSYPPAEPPQSGRGVTYSGSENASDYYLAAHK